MDFVTSWLVQNGFVPNNREWATLFWIAILALSVLPKREVREPLTGAIRRALGWKLLLVWTSFLGWIALAGVLAHWLGAWDSRLTKDTVLWAVTAGSVTLSRFSDAHKAWYFRNALWKILGVTALLEFLVSLVTFGLIVEIILQPVVLLFATVPILRWNHPDATAWHKRSLCFFLLLTTVLVGATAWNLAKTWSTTDWQLIAQRATWPVALSLWLLFLVFIWCLVASYEQAFTWLRQARQKDTGLWKAKLGVVLGLGINLKWIHHAAMGGTFHIARAESVQEAVSAAQAFRRERIAEERGEEAYQKNLVKFAEDSGSDTAGRPLDKREFRETRKALHWLHTCQVGWYRREPVGYKPDLVDRLDDDFERYGLPRPSGIELRVSVTGTAWYALRRTVGGHYFAIGASEEPPSTWRYDGPVEPDGFPGQSPDWGNQPLDDRASPNWRD